MDTEDKRKYNGAKKGENRGQGRKSKAKEDRVTRLSEDGIIDVYGSLPKFFKHIAKESISSFPHLKMLMEYRFGKPTERVENINKNFDAGELTAEKIKEINTLLESKY